MSAEQALRDGNLDEALSALQDEIRKDPSKVDLRVFLFQLLSVMGQWDRALTQLNVAGEMDPATIPMVQTYREALRCEALRTKVFAGETTPLVFGEPAPWVALLMEALRLGGAGEYEKAQSLRDEAFEGAPTTPGRLFGKDLPSPGEAEGEGPEGDPFAWMADGDTRLGPMFEAVVNGRYYWIPINRVRRLDIEAPTDLRDLVWAPAHFEWTNGGEAVALMPTRYPGSESSPDGAVRLARRTDWTEHPGNAYHGLGQRLLATDQGELSLLEIRRILFDETAPEEGAS